MIEIEGFENYFITSEGEVYSKKLNRPLSKWVDNTGYYQVLLYNKEGKRCHIRVHRLVAKHFVINSNSEIYNQVNHIDCNKLNNNYLNLEWTNNSLNTKHGYDNNVYKSTSSIPILVYDKQGNFVQEFSSIRSLSEELHLNRKTVSNILNGTKATNNYPYDFKYKN